MTNQKTIKVLIADISTRCEQTKDGVKVTAYGEVKFVNPSKEELRCGFNPENKKASYGFYMMNDERREIFNPDYIMKVNEKYCY